MYNREDQVWASTWGNQRPPNGRKGWLCDTHTTRSHSLPLLLHCFQWVSFASAERGAGWVQSCRSQWPLSGRRGESFGPWASILLPGGWVLSAPPPTQCEASLIWTLKPLLWELVLCYRWNEARETTYNITGKLYLNNKAAPNTTAISISFSILTSAQKKRWKRWTRLEYFFHLSIRLRVCKKTYCITMPWCHCKRLGKSVSNIIYPVHMRIEAHTHISSAEWQSFT